MEYQHMKLNHNEFLNLTPPDRPERVAYLMWKYMGYGAEEASKGIADDVVTGIIQRNWYKLYNVFCQKDSKVRRFRDLTDAKIALDALKELHKANRLDLISDIAQYSGQYRQMVDKEYGIIRGDAFNYGSNIPSQIKFV
jgi:hypothetical protein